MKTLTLSLLATFCTVLSFGQNLSDPTSALHSQTPAASQVFLNADRAESASVATQRYSSGYYSSAFRGGGGDESGKCGKYQTMKTAGIILTAVGGGLFVTGIALTAVGDAQLVSYNNSVINNGYGTGSNGFPERVAGGVSIALGIGGLGAGIPLLIIGVVKTKKYCGGGRSELQLGTNGHNLALNF